VRFVLADAPHADRAATIATRDTEVVALPGIVGGAGDAAAAGVAGAPIAEEEVELDAPATIVFTSGTTGQPKAAVLTHGNHVASAEAWASRLEPRPTDRWLACLPLYHVGGLAVPFRASQWGVPVEIHERFEPGAVARAIATGVSHVSLVGAMLERLLDADPAGHVPPTLRAVLVGGGPVSPATVDRARAVGYPVVTTYGMTETASGIVADGRPLRRVELGIGGAGADGVGEVLVRGAMVFRGYDADRAATDAVLRDGWLHTGDVGSFTRDRRLKIMDRRDDLIVSGGENVYPAEVESALREHPAVVDAAVVGRPDERWGSVPVAVVVVRPGTRIRDRDLADHVRARLAAYKVPRAFERVERLPRSPAGKLLRSELRAADDGGSGVPTTGAVVSRPRRTAARDVD
jgi:O-succinylbenzoic acid--CoA ligase